MKRIGKASAVIVMAFSFMLAGCPSMSDAAKLMKTYRLSLAAVQDGETGAFNHQLESQATHVSFSSKEERLAKYGQIVDNALSSGDKATVIAQVQNALSVVDSMETQDVTAIGDATQRGLVEVSVGALKNLLAQVQLALGQKGN